MGSVHCFPPSQQVSQSTPHTVQCFFNLRSMSGPVHTGHCSVSSQMGAFFSTARMIAWYDQRMETSDVVVGPYLLHVLRTSKGISKVEISSKPYIKTKNTNTKVDQLKRLLAAPVDMEGTAFQKKVWAAARKIPYGETRTYAQIAKAIGHPKAVRAVGTALGKNPACVAVPCHRVVPSSGGIGNYAYGTAMKRWLLDHEAGRV